MKTRIQVLTVEERKGNKNGKDWSMKVCQCIAYPTDPATGEETIKIGELILPKGHEPITPGNYDGEFGIQVGYDKQISGQLVRLVPHSPVRPSSASPAPSNTEKTGQVAKPA